MDELEFPLYAAELFNQNAEGENDPDAVSSGNESETEAAAQPCNCDCLTLLFDSVGIAIIPRFCANCGAELPLNYGTQYT